MQQEDKDKAKESDKPKTEKKGKSFVQEKRERKNSNLGVASSHTPPKNATANSKPLQHTSQKRTQNPKSKKPKKSSKSEKKNGDKVKTKNTKTPKHPKKGVAQQKQKKPKIPSKLQIKKTQSKKKSKEKTNFKKKVKESTYGQKKFQEKLKQTKERNKDDNIIFFGNESCANATSYATLIGKAKVNEFLTHDYLLQKIMIELYNSPDGLTKTDLAQRLGVDKSTIGRRLKKKQILPLISVDKLGTHHTCTLSFKGKSFMKYVLQVLTGYETHEVSSTRNAILARPHKLTYKAEIHRFPKELIPDKTKKGTHFIQGWKVWEVKNNFRFQREFPIKVSMEGSEYIENVLLDFMYKTNREAYVYIHLPEIFAETFDMAKRQVADINLKILDTLRKEGFMFKAGDYYSATITKTDGEYAIVNHPLARLCKAMGINEVKTEKWKVDASKRIPELEGHGETGEDIAEFEMEVLDLEATFVEDEKGNRMRLLDPIRTQAMTYENTKDLESYHTEMHGYLDVIKSSYKEMAKSTAKGFEELQNKLMFNLGGLPIDKQAELIEKSLAVLEKNEKLEKRLEELEKRLKK